MIVFFNKDIEEKEFDWFGYKTINKL